MRSILLPALLSLLAGAPALAQSAPGANSYVITQIADKGNDKTIGSATYNTRPITGGEVLTSSGSMHADKFSYSFSNTATVDAQGNLARDILRGSVHGSKASGDNIEFNTNSDSTGRKFTINISANGKQTTNTVDRHRGTVLLPDLDPAAYAMMARLALQQPQTAWVLIPKQDGILVPAEYQLLADLPGHLNGQTITVKHSAIAYSAQNSLVLEIFYTANGDLLETDLNSQGLRVTLAGFKLDKRPDPIPPPQNDAPTQNGQAPQQGQQPMQLQQPQQ